MKKRIWLSLGILAVVILVAGLASAITSSDLSNAGNQIIDWIQQIFGPFFQILLGVNTIDQYFFARILLLILLYFVIFVILKRVNIFKRYPFICAILSAVISILGARYLSEIEFISFILIPYGAVAISIAVFLPLFIYGFLVHESGVGGLGRRAAWIIFAVVFGGLWWARRTEVGNFNWIYLIGIAAIIIALFFDGTIHQYFEWEKRKKEFSAIERGSSLELKKRYKDALDILTASGGQDEEARQTIADIREEAKRRGIRLWE